MATLPPTHPPFGHHLLCFTVQVLQRTLREEQSNRDVAEIHRRRAKAATARTDRYLEGVLQVNQDLVSASTGGRPAHTATASTGPPTLSRAAKRQSNNRHYRTKSTPRRKELDRWEVVQSSRPTCAVDIDVGSAVGEMFNVARAGGDPVPSLQALYERIGFSAIMQEDALEEGGSTGFLPTSPRSHQSPRGRSALEGTYGSSESGDGEKSLRPRSQDSTWGDRVFAGSGTESPRANSSSGPREGNDGRQAGSGLWRGDGEVGYSFAHSPQARAMSGAERWPKVVRRLEDLATQLERERLDVERWYKTVVHRVGPKCRYILLTSYFRCKDVDLARLCIVCTNSAPSFTYSRHVHAPPIRLRQTRMPPGGCSRAGI